METLAKQIEERMHGVWKHCLIYEQDLERIWPINEEDQKKDRPICDEIRVPSEVLRQGNGCHIRQMAAAASWHPRRRKRTAAITSTAPRAFYEETKDKPLGLSSHHGCSLE